MEPMSDLPGATVRLGYQPKPEPAIVLRARKRLQRADPAKRQRENQLRRDKRTAVKPDRVEAGDPWNQPGWVPPPVDEPVDRGPFVWDRTRDAGIDADRCVECDSLIAEARLSISTASTLVNGFCNVACWLAFEHGEQQRLADLAAPPKAHKSWEPNGWLHSRWGGTGFRRLAKHGAQ